MSRRSKSRQRAGSKPKGVVAVRPCGESPRTERYRRVLRYACSIVVTAFASFAVLAGLGSHDQVATAEPTDPKRVVVPQHLAEFSDQLRAHIAHHVELAQSEPDNAMRHATLGLVYSANNLWPEARQCFENAHRLNSTLVLALYHLAITSAHLGHVDDAVSLLHQVLARHRTYAPAHHQLGDLYLALNRVTEAEQSFDRVVALAPSDPAGYVGLARVQLRIGNAAHAAALLQRSLRLGPDDSHAWYVLGLAYRALNRPVDAAQALAKGRNGYKSYMYDEWSATLNRHCKNIGHQIQLATATIKSGDVAGGIAVLEEAQRWHPDDLGVLTKLATAYRINKEPDRALGLLRRALDVDPSLPAVHEACAKHFLSVRDYKSALTYAQRAIDLSSSSAEAYRLRGHILARMRRSEEAIDALRESVRIYPPDADTHFYLGRLTMQLQRLTDACSHFADAIRHDASMVGAYVQLARCLMQLGEMDQAAKAVSDAQRLAPDHQTILAMADELASRGYPTGQ